MTVHIADPDIAEVAEIENALTRAILADDADAFAAAFAPDCLVHAPHNRIVEGKDSIALFNAGMIAYASFEQHVERRAKMGELVVSMGEEVMVPKGKAPHAGKTVRRRFTDVWSKADGAWKLVLRQATIISVA
ncbi:MAG TPA: SgcJ/EcaC family oxidoreductase [Rhizomicrobium sp.]|nr:SgcJ/EcaC family oxidoreductase [Rhizomicrobium sp.]